MGRLSCNIWVDPKCKCKHRYKKEAEEIWRMHSGEGGEMKEVEAGALRPQAKKCRQPPAAGKGKEQILPRASNGSVALPTP